jgi:hypothetical protein
MLTTAARGNPGGLRSGLTEVPMRSDNCVEDS